MKVNNETNTKQSQQKLNNLVKEQKMQYNS